MAQGDASALGDLGSAVDRDADASRARGHEPRGRRRVPDPKAMARFDGNVSQAAKALGLSRSRALSAAASGIGL